MSKAVLYGALGERPLSDPQADKSDWMSPIDRHRALWGARALLHVPYRGASVSFAHMDRLWVPLRPIPAARVIFWGHYNPRVSSTRSVMLEISAPMFASKRSFDVFKCFRSYTMRPILKNNRVTPCSVTVSPSSNTQSKLSSGTVWRSRPECRVGHKELVVSGMRVGIPGCPKTDVRLTNITRIVLFMSLSNLWAFSFKD